jgi:hypothetical protein
MRTSPVPTPAARKPKRNLVPLLAAAALVIVAGAGIWFVFLRSANHRPQPAALTSEARAYVHNLGLAGVEMKAKENMIGGTLVEITGQISNKGDRTLGRVELNCVFYDPYGQVVLRERVPIVRSSGMGLQPGETRNFRMPFDSIPAGWNQALPQLVIAAIEFQ